jgi:SAM-dependent methyltransferase
VETGSERPGLPAGQLQRARSFGAAAAQYAQHRPDYAGAAIRWCLAPVSGAQPVRVADVGAGTGILTSALAGLGADVTAVEPDQDMLAELRRKLPGVRAVAGSAEALPLPDHSVDAAISGSARSRSNQCMDWPHSTRVLAPGGVLAGLWNVEDDTVGWVAGLAAIRKTGTTLSRWRAAPPADSQQTVLRTGSS